jgi:CubicO group peptidase (beta-lactamase class C family)
MTLRSLVPLLLIVAVSFGLQNSSIPAAGAKVDALPLPMSGVAVPELRAFDEAMQQFMQERSIMAGTLAVMKDGRIVLSRGYGFADAQRTLTLGPDVPMRIASVVKPITAAAILRLIREGKLKPDDRAFVFLGVEPPPGRAGDSRLKDITIQHLLDHKGGWDREAAFDPMFRPLKIAAALGKPGPADARDIITFMAGQPLQFPPGGAADGKYADGKYSNFGYCVLGRVIEKVTGKRYVDYVREALLIPLKINSVELGRSLPRDRNPCEPYYADIGRTVNVVEPKNKVRVPWPDGGFYLEAMDSHGGLIASAPDLVRFAQAYTIRGEPCASKGKGKQFGRRTAFGSLPGTWSMLLWRDDGVNIAAIFNQRSDPSGLPYEAINKVLNNVTDGTKKWPR